MLLLCVFLFGKADAEPLKTIAAVRNLQYDETTVSPAVELEVTVVSHLYSGFDAQDPTGGIFFKSLNRLPLGTRLRITGHVTGGFYGPYITPSSITEIGKGAMPTPLRWLPEFATTGAGDNRWLEIEGLLADIQTTDRWSFARGTLITGSNDFGVRFISYDKGFDPEYMESLKGSRIKIKGTGAPLFNDAKQRIGTEFVCSSMESIKVLRESTITSIPVTLLRQLGKWDNRTEQLEFTKTKGVVTAIDHNQIVLQAADHAAPVISRESGSIEIGDLVEAIGIPKHFGYSVGLRFAELHKLAEQPSKPLVPVPDDDPLSRKLSWALVSIEGELAESSDDYWTLRIDNQLVPVKKVPTALKIGTRIEVTGVKVVDTTQRGEVRSVAILPRRATDIKILSSPPWWTPARYLTALLTLAIATVIVLSWTILLRRRVRTQTLLIQEQIEQNAALEERTRIAREFHDTLSQGFAGVGYQLKSVANHLEKDPGKAREKLTTATRMVEHSIKEAKHTLTSLRRNKDNQNHFIDNIDQIASDLCKTASITYEFESKGIELDIDQQQAHEVQRILIEAISNAIKHANATTIHASIDLGRDTLLASIKDNGIGFETAQLSSLTDQFGIRGMRERTNRLPDGKLDIETTPRTGTTVTLQFTPTLLS